MRFKLRCKATIAAERCDYCLENELTGLPHVTSGHRRHVSKQAVPTREKGQNRRFKLIFGGLVTIEKVVELDIFPRDFKQILYRR